MEIWRTVADIPDTFAHSVVTIGIFDGVHKGHSAILAKVMEIAKRDGLKAVALTFSPHPKIVHNPDDDLQLITSLDDRLQRLEAAGLDAVFVQHYDLEYAQLSPEDFVTKQLLGQLRARSVVVGQDVRFGKNNMGDGQLLRELSDKYNFTLELVDDLGNEDGIRWSSSWVRDLLNEGDVRGAARVLGRAHRIRGVVQHGFKRGRELGVPTANLAGNNLGEVPANGVYAGWLVTTVPGAKATVHLPAAISVGTNPQFAGTERTVEAHVLGRSDLNLYGEEIALDFIEFLRPMLKFSSLDELLAQMDDDLRQTAEVLGVPVSTRLDPKSVTAS
ncbi:MAG: bifunctional riboflavin kinase/FMN adenylyltransferase [Actinomycetales bacterium]|nr:MAG: bifunctional riboflavin kinase/FMN adenylyltransferase [Actinomycetales bacterium]